MPKIAKAPEADASSASLSDYAGGRPISNRLRILSKNRFALFGTRFKRLQLPSGRE